MGPHSALVFAKDSPSSSPLKPWLICNILLARIIILIKQQLEFPSSPSPMPELPSTPQNPHEQAIAQQITTKDISMRRQLVKNTSQTYIQPFQPKEQLENTVSRKISVQSAWFECGSNQNDIFREAAFSCVSAFEPRASSKKQCLKIYSVINVKRKESLNRKSYKTAKINVSLNNKTQKKPATQNKPAHEAKSSLAQIDKAAKQNKIPFYQQEITIDVNLPLKQQTPTKKVKQIKQPDFHDKHPLRGSQRCLNGSYLSKIIAERALQPKNKPFPN